MICSIWIYSMRIFLYYLACINIPDLKWIFDIFVQGESSVRLFSHFYAHQSNFWIFIHLSTWNVRDIENYTSTGIAKQLVDDLNAQSLCRSTVFKSNSWFFLKKLGRFPFSNVISAPLVPNKPLQGERVGQKLYFYMTKFTNITILKPESFALSRSGP